MPFLHPTRKHTKNKAGSGNDKKSCTKCIQCAKCRICCIFFKQKIYEIYKNKTMANKKYKHVFMVNKNNNLYLKYTYINIIQILLLVH